MIPSNITSGRVSKKTGTASVLDFEFTNSRHLSIKLAINTNYLVLRVAI